MKWKLLLLLLLGLFLVLYLRKLRGSVPPETDRLAEARRRVLPALKEELKRKHFRLGAPVFIRVFKEEKELELWMRDDMDGRWRLFRAWPVVNYGGGRLGPKLKEGDGVAPEGIYHVGVRQLNPKSKFHLAFNLGYPNALDKYHKRTGSFLMVHGGEESIGCYAMTGPVIEIIYVLVDAALRGRGQDEISVHCFPFRPSPERLAREKNSEWHAFWTNLKEGYDLFQQTRVPPLVGHRDGVYVFRKRDP